MIRQTATLTLLALALPAAAQTGTDRAASAPAAPAPEKKLCRTMTVTGSIMGGKRVCHTKGEWAEIDAANGNAAFTARDPRGRYGGLGASNPN